MNQKYPQNNKKGEEPEKKVDWDSYIQMAKAKLDYEATKWKVFTKTPLYKINKGDKEKVETFDSW